MVWFIEFLTAGTSGMVLGLAYKKRQEIGRTASILAGSAGILMAVNSLLISYVSRVVNDMAEDWTELRRHVPVMAWTSAKNLLEGTSAVLYSVALVLLALAVFAPRTVNADRE